MLISIAFSLLFVIMKIMKSLTTQRVDDFINVCRYLVFGMWIVKFVVGIKYLGRFIKILVNTNRSINYFYLMNLKGSFIHIRDYFHW